MLGGLIAVILIVTVLFSPVLVLILLIDRSNLKSKLRKQLADEALERAAYQRGYRQAVADIEGMTVRADVSSETATLHQVITQPENGFDDDQPAVSISERTNESLDNTPTTQSTQSTSATAPPAVVAKRDPNAMLNAVLFVAGMLIVAGAAAFIATTASPSLKVLALWIAVLLFYGGGIMLYMRSVRLRSAAIAFTAIGMALVPLTGLVLHSVLGVDGTTAWLLTSVAAVALYSGATAFLKHQVAAYVAIGAVVSLALALSRSLSTDIAWLIVPIIVVGILCQIVNYVLADRLPRYARKPIADSSILLGVGAVAFSVPLWSVLSYLQLELIVGLTLMQYTLYYLQAKRYLFAAISRCLLVLIMIIATMHIADGRADHSLLLGLGVIVAAFVQQAISLYLWPKHRKSERKGQFEMTMLVTAYVVQWLVMILWWFESIHIAAVNSSLLLLMAISWLYQMRLGVFNWLYGCLAVTVVLPFTFIRWVVEDAILRGTAAAWYFLAMIVVSIGVYAAITASKQARHWWFVATVVYAMLAMILGSWHESTVLTFGLVLVTAFMYLAYYRERQDAILYVAGALLTATIMRLLYVSTGIGDGLLTGVITVTAFLASGVLQFAFGEVLLQRGATMAASVLRRSSALLFGLAFMPGVALLAGESLGVQLLSSLGALLLAGTLTLHYIRHKSPFYGELAVYAVTAAGLSALHILDTTRSVDWLVYVHCIAAALVGAGLLYSAKDRLTRMKTALGLLTLFVAGAALGGGASYQILFLVEQTVVLIAGSFLAQRWAIIWGAVAITLALLYMLRDVQFLVPLLLGLALIGYVIWRLRTSNRSE